MKVYDSRRVFDERMRKLEWIVGSGSSITWVIADGKRMAGIVVVGAKKEDIPELKGKPIVIDMLANVLEKTIEFVITIYDRPGSKFRMNFRLFLSKEEDRKLLEALLKQDLIPVGFYKDGFLQKSGAIRFSSETKMRLRKLLESLGFPQL